MKPTTALTTAAAAVGLAGAVVWQRRGGDGRAGDTGGEDSAREGRWLVLTVHRSPEEVAAGLPATMLEVETVELEVRPAPGDKGSEVAVRSRGERPTRDELRAALREAKQVLETGEVLRVDPQPAGRRAATPWSKAMAVATKLAGRKGVL